MKLLSGVEFLPGGELLAVFLDGVQRLDTTGKRVLARRKAKFPAVAVSRASGRLFIADGNKVFEHDPVSLKPTGKALGLAAERGVNGTWASLAVSPDDSLVAGINRGNTLHVRELAGTKSESHPGYGARREALAFLGPRTFLNVHGNTLAEVRTFGEGRSLQLDGLTFAAGGDGHVLAWSIGGEGQLYAADGKKLGGLKVKPSGAAFAGGLVVVMSEDGVTCFDLETRRVRAQRRLRTTGPMGLGVDRVAVGTASGLVLLSFPGLEPLDALPKEEPPVVERPAAPPKEKKAPRAKPSALRTKLEALGATALGGSVTEAQLASAKKKLGCAVPKALAAAWRDVDGWCVHDSAGGLNSLAALLETSSEDVLWNDGFDEQFDGPPLVGLPKLKKLRVLWSLPGQAEAVGLDPKTGALFFGEPNSVRALKLSLEEYLALTLAPDFLEKVRAAR